MRWTTLVWLLAVVATGVGGYLAGASDPASTPRSGREPLPSSSAAGETPARVSTDAPEPSPPAPDDAAVRRRVAERMRDLLGEDADPAQVEKAVAEVRALRKRLRDANARAERTVANNIADDILQERKVLGEGDASGLPTLLHSIGTERTRAPSLVADRSKFAEMFARNAEGRILDGTAGELPDEGNVVRFPSGVHALDAASWSRRDEFPNDIVVEGAGMDATLLRLNAAIQPRSTVRTLAFRDVTIDCNQHYFVDTNNARPLVLRLERVRVVGFDSGTGRSVMFKVRMGALYATGCRFEAGYGRVPGSGTLFRVNQALLVRLEDCTIRGPFTSLFDIDAGATYHLYRCAYENVREANRGLQKEPPDGVTFSECRFDFAPDRVEGPRSLGEIHPDWERG